MESLMSAVFVFHMVLSQPCALFQIWWSMNTVGTRQKNIKILTIVTFGVCFSGLGY